jgi:hypothetical protein
VNQDRQAAGLAPVVWDDVAASAGLAHAKEMAQFGYMSHWNLEGRGPDYRYTLAGGLNVVRENVYLYEHSLDAGPTSREDWQALVQEAEQSLMQSPLHRDNIMTPEHTHVGIGIAYNGANGHLTIAQEFVNHYVTLQPLGLWASLGKPIIIRGQLVTGASKPVINLAYEPFPKELTVADLNNTGPYESPVQTYQVVPLSVDTGRRFTQSITLDNKGQTGLYHIRIGIETKFGQILAADVVLAVQ